MKNKSLFGILLFALIFSLGALNCSSGGVSKVTISIDLGLQNKAAVNAHENSVFDRIVRFFVKDAKAQEAPSGITSIGLTVTGAGMSDINETYSADTSMITLDVPAGNARMFQVTAYRPTGNYGGSATQDLAVGQSVDIPITMAMQYANVTINPAFPDGDPASTTLTYAVDVTTLGETVLSSSFTPGTPKQVPAGDSKYFVVLISTPSVTFRGTAANQTLTADANITVDVDNMTLYKTKVIIPDCYYSSASNYGRIVQINDYSDWGTDGEGRIIRLGYDHLGISSFYPYDIDFDSQGRIYIVCYQNTTNSLIRMNDINSTPDIIIEELGSGYANSSPLQIC